MELPLIILSIMGAFVGTSVLGFWFIVFYAMLSRGRTRAEADAQFEALNNPTVGSSIQEVCCVNASSSPLAALTRHKKVFCHSNKGTARFL